MEANQELNHINNALSRARTFGLEAEVMWSAMKHLLIRVEAGEKPVDMDVGESVEAALDDWDI